MAAKTDKTQARRELAEVYLREAAYETLSWKSRVDAAFDAVYLLALAVLGEELADTYEHPDSAALIAVAEKLGWPASRVAPAVNHIELRYDIDQHPLIYGVAAVGNEGDAPAGRSATDALGAMVLIAGQLKAADDLATKGGQANGTL